MRSRYVLASLLGAGLALLIALPTPADEAPSKEKLDKLLEQMGSGTFAEREKATKELSAIGVPALEALRKAAKSEDAEVRKRAEDIIPKIEKQAESIRILTPKRVHLVYKDTPLSEAVADFQKKSGYTLHLHDPEGKLKDRKVTLDTGATTFWHALGMFCDKAELTEGTLGDLIQAPMPPVGVPGGVPVPPLPPQRIRPLPPVKGPGLAAPPPPTTAPAQPAPAPLPAVAPRPILRRGAPMIPAMGFLAKRLILKDGKEKKLPTDDASAVRIRALGKSEMFGNPGEGEMILALEVSPEPKVLWEELKSIHIDKAIDDQDQKLPQVIPQVEGVGAAAVGVGGGIGGGPGIARPMIMIARPAVPMPGMWGGWVGGLSLSQPVPVQLKKGAKAAKSLKELKGVITAQLLTEVQPMITANKLKADETFKGKEGGFIKIVEVKEEEDKTTIRLEFEQPSPEKIVPAMLENVMAGFGGGGGGVGVPIRIQPRPGVKIVPAPGAAPAPGLAAPPQAAPPPVQVAPVQVQVAPVQAQIVIQGGNVGFGGPMQTTESFNGLTVQNDKGKVLPIQIGQTQGRFQQLPGGGFVQTLTYTFICPHDKDKGKPAKVVFLGRKRTTVDIPFALQDVPLPK